MADIQEDSALENSDASDEKPTGCHVNKKLLLAIVIPVSIVVILAIVLGCVFGLKKKKTTEVDGDIYISEYKTITSASYYSEILGKTEINKPVKGIHNEGQYSNYPKYGTTLREVLGPDKENLRNQIIEESTYLAAGVSKTAQEYQYSWMDKDGKLYQGTTSNPKQSTNKYRTRTLLSDNQRQLYKHNASIGLYLGDVSDDEPRVIKKIMLSKRPFMKCYSVTGLYAPAGEVIKVELSKADMDATNGITFHIGQALNNGQANNIWAAKNQMQRFPILLNTMTLNKDTTTFDNKTNTYTGYIGSFIGGPIYVRATSVDITLTISGGVVYPHFILGVTTPEMFNESLKSSAPYFDLEVWDLGVLHSGPRQYMKNFNYDDLYKAAILWDKVASVTTYRNQQNIVFIYDTFVAAGAAVAFPGRSSVNCPLGWMTASLNYNSIVTVGTWGNFHEYHHNFQGYGVGNGGEVTNNGLNLVSYALFTKISSNRRPGNYGAQGLDCWTSYTSSVYALNEVLKIKSTGNPSNGKQGLGLYACLLHNFGADCYIKVKGYGGPQNYAGYMKHWQDVTHNNMYYYFQELLDGTGVTNNADEKYPTFVPIACLYQTGRSYLYYNTTTNKNEKKYFKTMRPYVIPYGIPFDIDLSIYTVSGDQYQSGSIYLPTNPDKTKRFEYKIKSITQPQNGKVNKVNDFLYRYVPQEDQENYTSGEIYCTLEIKDTKNQLKVDDIDLILEFEMSHETKKLTLERTLYNYKESNMYVNATDAYNNNFKGYESFEKIDHSNPTQNANTDIWQHPNTEANHEKYPNAPDHYFMKENRIQVLEGKLLFSEDSKYRIYLRGRSNLALYFSLDGKDYNLGAKITELYEASSKFKTNLNNTYFDVEYTEDGSVSVTTYVEETEISRQYQLNPDKNGDIRNWLYVKEILIDKTVKGMASFIGLGFAEWTVATFSMTTTYLDKDGNVITDDTDPNITVIWSNYSDYQGNVVAYKKAFSYNSTVEYYKPGDKGLDEINETEFSSLTKEQITPPKGNPTYANAYRASYQFPDNKAFESDYFYKRTYSDSYTDSTSINTWNEGVSLVETNFVAESDTYKIDNLFKEGYNTFIHPNENTAAGTYFTIDMGKEISANHIVFNGRLPNPANTAQQGFPKNFAIYISNDKNGPYTKIGDFVNNDGNGNNGNRAVTVNLGESYSFRYVNITVASSHSNTGRIILSAIGFSDILSLTGTGNLIIISGDNVVCTGSWENKPAFSKFGSVFVGKKGSKIKFEFTGTRLAATTSTKFGSNYQINIDGNKVDSIEVKKLTKEYGITYLSPKLSNQRHKVEVVCNGEANFDSFSYFIE